MNFYSKQLQIAHPVTYEIETICIKKAADICNVTLRTAQRWHATKKIPPPAMKLLQIYTHGIIPNQDWEKRGYFISKSGYLCSKHHGYHWLPNQLDALWVHLQQLQAQQAELREKNRELQPDQKPMLLVINGGRK